MVFWVRQRVYSRIQVSGTFQRRANSAESIISQREIGDPQKTAILGNFRFDYRNKKIDLSEVSWFKKVFRTAHTKMDHDPEVWAKVEELILSVIE